LYVLVCMASVFVMATGPLFYEVAVDTAFPVAEGLATIVLTLGGTVASFIFLLLPIFGVNIGDWVNYLSAGAGLVGVVAMLLFRDRLKRTEEDSSERARGGSGGGSGSEPRGRGGREPRAGGDGRGGRGGGQQGKFRRARQTSEELFISTGAREQHV
jgi:hypothetical protein